LEVGVKATSGGPPLIPKQAVKRLVTKVRNQRMNTNSKA
jgi:hypothetical protein